MTFHPIKSATKMPMSPRLLRPRQTGFNPRSISGLALWLDAADSQTLYTTDAGPVTAVSSPLDIAGCALWLDASDASSITQSGGLVSQWNDKSGNSRNFTASGSARPTLTASGLNGRSVVTFDGTATQMLAAGGFLQTASVTILTVFKYNSGQYGGIISSCDNANDASPRFVIHNGNFRQFGYGNFSDVTQVTSPALMSGVVASGASSIYQGGALGDSDAVSGTLTTGNTQTAIGTYRTNAGNTLNGYIAEVVVFLSALSTADRARVEAYLAAKWGISGVHAPATAANDPVGAWLDKSGNGRHARQATGALRPTRNATIGGRRALAVPNVSGAGFSHIPAPTTSSAITIFSVARFSAAASGQWAMFGNVAGTATVPAASPTVVTSAFGSGNPSMYSQGAFIGTASGSANRPGLLAALNERTAILTTSGANVSGWGGDWRLWNYGGSFQFTGDNGEQIVYGRVLSDAERQRIERYLASKWGITLAPQVSNADAQDWVNRVYQNGGTVSEATASAVNAFCNSIDAAGIRDRFFRLNLFAGNSDANLAAVRTPLFRGPSLTGTQYGNAIDTNINFVQGDYSESVGLNANGSVGSSFKYLDTGTANNSLPSVATGHMSVFRGPFATGGITTFGLIGTRIAVSHIYEIRQTGFENASGLWGGAVSAQESSGNTGRRLLLATRTASNSLTLYGNAVALATSSSSVTPSAVSDSFLVFNRRNADGAIDATGGFPGVISAYSIGDGMTAAQVASYHTALTAFLAALGRATT